jgi:hypothetical protein
MSTLPNLDNANAKPTRDIFGTRRRREGGPQGEAAAQVIHRVEAALRDVAEGPQLDATEIANQNGLDELPDPAPSAPAIAEERAQQLVTNISSQMLGELRSLREQIDELMRDMNERREMIREAIRAHAEFAESSIQHKIIIAESVAKLRAEFELSRTPLPPMRKI